MWFEPGRLLPGVAEGEDVFSTLELEGNEHLVVPKDRGLGDTLPDLDEGGAPDFKSAAPGILHVQSADGAEVEVVDRFFGGASAGTLGGEPPAGSGWQLLQSDSPGLTSSSQRQIDRTDFYPCSSDLKPASHHATGFCEGKE